MRNKVIIGRILFWGTLISFIFSFVLVAIIGEPDIFSVTGIIRYSWIMLLFIPIGLVSIIYGFILRKHNHKYKKNFIIAFICIPLLIVFGTFRFNSRNTVYYDNSNLIEIEKTDNYNFPEHLKITTQIFQDYKITRAKITSSNEKISFEQSINTDSRWNQSLTQKIKGALPMMFLIESERFDSFLIYSKTVNSYDSDTFTNGTHEIILMMYNKQKGSFLIINECFIEIT